VLYFTHPSARNAVAKGAIMADLALANNRHSHFQNSYCVLGWNALDDQCLSVQKRYVIERLHDL
jgi:hypothetical protein